MNRRKMPKECNGQRVIANVNCSSNEAGIQRIKISENGTKNSDRGFAGYNGKGMADGGSLMHDMKNKKLIEDDAKSKCRNHGKGKGDVARERWKILAKALLVPMKNNSKTGRDISVRRFTSFGLVTPNKLEYKEKDGGWVKYNAKIQNTKYVIEVHHLHQKLTAKELIGFNNTGNICIWPSEEVLAYYLLSNIHTFNEKEVLEVGGGMTCLAGIMLGKYGKAKRINLTDGNKISVDNVQRIIMRNQLDKARVGCCVLNWSDYNSVMDKYDVVLSSDCLFFDETRSDLVETMWHSLRESGIALVMAPKRGNTLDLFLAKAIEKGFLCISQKHYSDVVWRQHLKFKESNSEYDEDIHYPILLMLTKSSQGVSLQNCLSILTH